MEKRERGEHRGETNHGRKRRETIEAEEKNEAKEKGGCGIAARGTARTFGRGLRRSTVAHFARKVRGANIVAAKHELKIQQSHGPERWSCSLRVRGPHFASKVSYNAGAATDDYAALTQISAARALLPIFNLEHPKVIRWPSILLTRVRDKDCVKNRVKRAKIVCFTLC